MKTGWYIVWLLMILSGSIMCNIHGFGIDTWQNWVWLGIVILSYFAGRGMGK